MVSSISILGHLFMHLKGNSSRAWYVSRNYFTLHNIFCRVGLHVMWVRFDDSSHILHENQQRLAWHMTYFARSHTHHHSRKNHTLQMLYTSKYLCMYIIHCITTIQQDNYNAGLLFCSLHEQVLLQTMPLAAVVLVCASHGSIAKSTKVEKPIRVECQQQFNIQPYCIWD